MLGVCMLNLNSVDFGELKFPQPLPFCEEPSLSWNLFVQNEQLGVDALECGIHRLDFYDNQVRSALMHYIEFPYETLYMYSGTGRGKTYAALCLLRHWFHKNKWVRYLQGSQITDIAKNKSIEYLKEVYGDCEFLVIDDFGVNLPADWDQRITYELIDYRCQKLKLPTVITTNCSKDQLRKIVGERTVSRLRGTEIEFCGVDLR